MGENESIRQREAKNEQNTAGSGSREARRQPLSFLLLCCLSFPLFPLPVPSRKEWPRRLRSSVLLKTPGALGKVTVYYGHEGSVASPTTIPLPHGPAGHSPIQFPTCPSLPQSPFAASLQDRLSQQIWLWVQVRELTSVDRWRVTKEDIYVNLWSLHTHTCAHM